MPGGTMGEVRRVGSTVRRPAGPWTPQVQALMRELRARGLAFVPEPYGLDDVGRESVEFIDGDVGVYPMPEWVWSDHLLVEVGQVLRRLHDATRDLAKPVAGWQRDAVQPADVVCHSDLAPYNVVCRDGHLVAVIDWDFAVPAPAGWDLGYAAYRWISLTAPENRDGRVADLAEQLRRLEVLAEAYGDVEPDELVRWAVVRLDDLVALIETQAAAGDERFVAAVAGGHPELYRRDARWIRDSYGLGN
ncbi:MAG: aminoglycoside phosphotransferase family protein [Candidatus Nanopelagicales bacterium]